MNRWEVLGALLFAGLFALFAFWRIEAFDSTALRGVIAAFLFGFYCAIVVFGTAGKKRTLSLASQTSLGVIFACTLAALFAAPLAGYFVAALLGLILGFTADKWVELIQLP